MEEEIVLCAANSYEQKYYLNPELKCCLKVSSRNEYYVCTLHRRCRRDLDGFL